MIGPELLLACAPNVAPQTIERVIRVESRGDPLAINVNKGRLHRRPTDAADAAALARAYIAQGYTVDLGLMQVNSTNVARLGYRIEEMFEPCKNIAAGGRVLAEFYAAARPRHESEQAALRAALSAYNTGNFVAGFQNGYLSRYGIGRPVVLAREPAIDPNTADTAVFVRKKEETPMSNPNDQRQAPPAATPAPVISRNPEDADIPGVQVQHSADDAEALGAFEDDATGEAAAWAANQDGREPAAADDAEGSGIVVGGKKVGGK